MTLNNSKFIISVLSVILTALLAVLVISAYSIYGNNTETRRLLSVSSATDEAKLRAHFARSIRTEKEVELEMFESFVLTEDKFVGLIETIEETGRELGLDADVLSVDKIEGEKIIKMTIETVGNWGNAFSFLSAMENVPYKVMAEELELSKEGSEWNLRVILSLNYFE